MKAFVEYLHYGTTGKLIPVCGDRGIVILDGRNNLQTWIKDAHSFNGFRRPEYPGFNIHVGDLHNSRIVYHWEHAQ